MKNKYVVSPRENRNYVRKNMDTLIDNALTLSRYGKDDPVTEIARRNFEEAFNFILTGENIETDNECLLEIHRIMMRDLNENIHSELSEEQCEELAAMINQPAKANVEIALDVMLYILDRRLFEDGDVRVAIMFANKIMIENGGGVISVPGSYRAKFRELYYDYKETHSDEFKNWLYKYCIKGPKVEY